MKKIIHTDKAPAAIGVYSQAVQVGATVYVSGQIGLNPQTMDLAPGGFEAELRQALQNLSEICLASGGTLANVVKFTVYLINMQDFARLNEVFADYLTPPFPARAAVAVTQLPKAAQVELEAVLQLPFVS